MPGTADVAWALDEVKERAKPLTLFRNYDEGAHRLLFATEKFRNTFGDLFREFADNMCDDVVDGITDRLQITGWTSTDDSLNTLADAAWERMRGEARTGQVHRNAFQAGDGWLIVAEGPTGFTAHSQDPRLMCIRYDVENPDEKALVGKVWKVAGSKRWRVNLYYPDRLERWASKGSANDGGMPGVGAFSLLAAGDPLLAEDLEDGITALETGMPVFHYPNGTIGDYGRSLLAKCIPVQDALNKSVADMLVAMEFHAYPQRWATGIETEIDPATGQERKPFQAGEGRLWRTKSKEASFGQFTPGGMTDYLDVQDSFRLEIGRKGYLPPYAIPLRNSANAPSGIALLVAEGRTVKVARDRQRDWGTEHRAMMAYGLNIDRPGAKVTPADLDATWAPPETRDEKALVEMLLLKKELGIPDDELFLEAGYTQDEVDDFLDRAAEQQAAQGATLSVLQGGRGMVTAGQAGTLNDALGVPGGPQAPAGGATPLAQG